MQQSLIQTLAKLTCVVAFVIFVLGILTPISPSTLEISTIEAQALPPGITPPPPSSPPPPAINPRFLPGGPDAIGRNEIFPDGTRNLVDPDTGLEGIERPRDPSSPGGAPGSGAAETPPTPDPAVQVNPGNTINSYLHAFVVTYVGWLMAHAGAFFDYTFREFIIGFGQNFRTSNTGWAVQQVWETVRDIFNLTFIFGIIYIGFRLILNGDDSRAKSTLVTLLAAALLVNFSLFITKFVIDVANITATEIARSVEPIEAGSTVGGGGTTTLASGGFGELFMNYLGLSSALNTDAFLGTAEDGSPEIDFTNSRASLGYIFGLLLLFLITAFVFLAGAVMVTIRFFVLLIYMIFSPFMFLGWVFPNFASESSKWWRGFLGKAFFAPAYVFMLYITLLLMTQYAEGRPTAATDMGALFGSRQVDQAGEAFAYFALVTVSLLASLVIAQKMGATGATTAIAIGHRVRRGTQVALGGATAGLAARGLRNTVGAGAHAMSQSDTMRNLATNKWTSAVGGKALYNVTRATADKSFDARQIAGVGKAIGVGEGKKGGFTTRLKEAEKKESEFLDSIGTRKVDKEKKELEEAQKNVEKRKQKLKEETQEERDEVKTLRQEYKTATKERKVQIASEILAMEVEMKRKETEAQKDIDALESLVSKAENAVATAEYKYQIAYNESVTKWRKTWGRAGAIAGGVAVGAGVGVLTGGAAPLLAMAAGASTGLAFTGANYNSRKVAAAATKEYGADGTDKKKAKKQKEKIKELVSEIEESSDKKKDKEEAKPDKT